MSTEIPAEAYEAYPSECGCKDYDRGVQAGRKAERERLAAEIEPHAKRWIRDPSHPPVIGDVVWQLRQILQGTQEGGTDA